jgi:hypothetical protein
VTIVGGRPVRGGAAVMTHVAVAGAVVHVVLVSGLSLGTLLLIRLPFLGGQSLSIRVIATAISLAHIPLASWAIWVRMTIGSADPTYVSSFSSTMAAAVVLRTVSYVVFLALFSGLVTRFSRTSWARSAVAVILPAAGYLAADAVWRTVGGSL